MGQIPLPGKLEKYELKGVKRKPVRACPKCGLLRANVNEHMDTMSCVARQNTNKMHAIGMSTFWGNPAALRDAGVRVEDLPSRYFHGCQYWGGRILNSIWVPEWVIPIWLEQQDRYLRYKTRAVELRELVENPGLIEIKLVHVALDSDTSAGHLAVQALRRKADWEPHLKAHGCRAA